MNETKPEIAGMDLIMTDSIKDKFKLMREMNAGSLKLITRDLNDKPISGMFFIDGAEETAEMIQTFDKVEASWAEDVSKN